jgi:hypothetical protein
LWKLSYEKFQEEAHQAKFAQSSAFTFRSSWKNPEIEFLMVSLPELENR